MSFEVGFEHVNKNLVFKVEDYEEKVRKINEFLEYERTNPNNYIGWLHYASHINHDLVESIKKQAKYFRENYDTLVVCGIGGSYLGARAVIEAVNGLMPQDKFKVLYFGQTLDPNYTSQMLAYLKHKNFCVACISKSGTTTETSIAFRLLKDLLEKKHGKKGAADAIACVTSIGKGALYKMAQKEGYSVFELPVNIGGRYSVITPVGLLPIACAGIDIDRFIAGFVRAEEKFGSPELSQNPAYQYAAEQNLLYNNGYNIELLVTYEPRLQALAEWYKQLYDESNGKDRKGLLVMSSTFTTDLHSLGQFIQDGTKDLFETVLLFDNPKIDVVIPWNDDDSDELNYIANKKLSYVNKKASEGTISAHANDGSVPNIIIEIDTLDEYKFGEFLYFSMRACAMAGFLLDVNPFNQPGVEIYKKNMFKLLGKKGY